MVTKQKILIVDDDENIAELIEMLRQDAVEKYKEEHGWIPITERMPKEEEYILVSFENYTLPDIGRYENDGSDKFYPGDDAARPDASGHRWLSGLSRDPQ
jgi:hypothetical protein